MKIITRGFGFDSLIITRGFGGILHWLKTLISNTFIKIPSIRREKVYIIPTDRQFSIGPTNGKIN